MKIIELENCRIFTNKYNNTSYSTTIPLNDLQQDLIISFNPISNLYKDENYEGESPFKPFQNNLWYVTDWIFERIRGGK